MNYFELYDIPISLKVDANIIKQKFYALSRKCHPDFFGNETDDEQAEALEKSSHINKAFKIFNSFDETIKYLLQLKGLMQEDEKYNLPSNFLMEVMEINEQLQEAKMENDEEKIASCKLQVASLNKEIYEPVKEIMEYYQDDIISEKELLQVKEYYYKKKYLDRIVSPSLNH